MRPIDFPGANLTLTKPEGATDEECGSLRVHCDGETCLSMWEFSDEDLAKIVQSKRVHLWVWSGSTQPPVALAVVEPWNRTAPIPPVDPVALIDVLCRDRAGVLQRESVHLDEAGKLGHWHRILETEHLRKTAAACIAGRTFQGRPVARVLSDTAFHLERLRLAIRAHRDATTGQRMCWENDVALWSALGEPDPVDPRPPGWLAFLWGCLKYRWSRRGCRCRPPG